MFISLWAHIFKLNGFDTNLYIVSDQYTGIKVFFIILIFFYEPAHYKLYNMN